MFCCRLLTAFKFNIKKQQLRKTMNKVSKGLENRLDSDQNIDNLILIWVQTDCKCYQETTKVAAGKDRVKIINEVC